MINIDGIIDTTKELVAIPSQGGIDSPDAILCYLKNKCESMGLPVEILTFDDKKVALAIPIMNDPGAPVWLLSAVVDTAPVGDPASWDTDPFVPVVKDGWLYGRGAADSKVGAAIFLELAEHARKSGKNFIIHFDADEHTGKFCGALALIKKYPNIAGGVLAYPGDDKLVIGSRGFYRAVAHVKGRAEHSGGSRPAADNAVITACDFIRSLNLDIGADKFPLPPKLSVTAVHGGAFFAAIPDKVGVNIDIRTTFDFDGALAEKFLRGRAGEWGDKIAIEEFGQWPPYMLDEKSHIRLAFEKTVKESGLCVPSMVSGPSNVGNLFAMRGIGVAAGFGVAFRNAHAANECIELSGIGKAAEVYARLIDNI